MTAAVVSWADLSTAALLLMIGCCTRWLWKTEKAEADDRRLARTLAASRFRPEVPDVADAYARTEPERKAS